MKIKNKLNKFRIGIIILIIIFNKLSYAAAATDNSNKPEFNETAAKEYINLFTPPDPTISEDTWRVDIGPSASTTDEIELAKIDYAKRRNVDGKIIGPRKNEKSIGSDAANSQNGGNTPTSANSAKESKWNVESGSNWDGEE